MRGRQVAARATHASRARQELVGYRAGPGQASCGSLAGALGRGGGDALQRVPSSGGMRKSVSFNALRRVVLVPSAKEMSQEAIRQKWCV